MVLKRSGPVKGRLSTPMRSTGSGSWPAARAASVAPSTPARAARAASERSPASRRAVSSDSGAAAATKESDAASSTAARRKERDMETPQTNKKVAGERTGRTSTGQVGENFRRGVCVSREIRDREEGAARAHAAGAGLGRQSAERVEPPAPAAQPEAKAWPPSLFQRTGRRRQHADDTARVVRRPCLRKSRHRPLPVPSLRRCSCRGRHNLQVPFARKALPPSKRA